MEESIKLLEEVQLEEVQLGEIQLEKKQLEEVQLKKSVKKGDQPLTSGPLSESSTIPLS